MNDLAERLIEFSQSRTPRGADNIWRAAHRRLRRRRLARASAVAVTVAGLVAVAVVAAAGHHDSGRVRTPPPTTAAPAPSVPPRQAAIALSHQMLDDVAFPVPAQLFRGPPLKGSPLGYHTGIGNLVYASRAWTVNEPPENLWRWLQTHAPRGYVLYESGSDGGADAKWNLTYAIADPPTNISDAEVQLGISGNSSGPAVIHGYADAGWTNPRPAREFVPATDHTVTITVVLKRYGRPLDVPLGKPIVITDADQAQTLIRQFNALRVLPPRSIYAGCPSPAATGVYRITFASSPTAKPDIVAKVGGCVSVDVNTPTRAAPALLDGPANTFLTSVTHALVLSETPPR